MRRIGGADPAAIQFCKATPSLAGRLPAAGIHVAIGAERIAVAGYRLQHATAMHLAEQMMSLATFRSRLNLHWGRSTPNNLHGSRLLLPLRVRKSYRGAQPTCPQVAESILQCVTRNFWRQNGRRRVENRLRGDIDQLLSQFSIPARRLSRSAISGYTSKRYPTAMADVPEHRCQAPVTWWVPCGLRPAPGTGGVPQA